MRLNIIDSQQASSMAQTGMNCTVCVYSRRQIPSQADMSYDSTAGCVDRYNFLHVCKTLLFTLSETSQDRQEIDTQNKEAFLLFGET